MSRPKPNIILNYTDSKTYRSEQVLEAAGVYAVFYQDKPINLRTLNSLVNHPGPRYLKTSFSNPGHCHNLAAKLNKLFKTDQFKVYLLSGGTPIDEA